MAVIKRFKGFGSFKPGSGSKKSLPQKQAPQKQKHGLSLNVPSLYALRRGDNLSELGIDLQSAEKLASAMAQVINVPMSFAAPAGPMMGAGATIMVAARYQQEAVDLWVKNPEAALAFMIEHNRKVALKPHERLNIVEAVTLNPELANPQSWHAAMLSAEKLAGQILELPQGLSPKAIYQRWRILQQRRTEAKL